MDKSPGGEQPLVPIAGRWNLTEQLRFALKRSLPPDGIKLISMLLRPKRAATRAFARWNARRRALPPELRGTFKNLWREAHDRWSEGLTEPTAPPQSLPILDSGYRVFVRPGTSDVLLYEEVIVNERYGRAPLRHVRTIVDCGANIGLTSAYLLARWPSARVVALEPDPVNFALCVRNLTQFGDRAIVLQAALWGRPARMFVESTSRAGTWASTVNPVDESMAAPETVLDGFDVPTLLQRLALTQVDLLKIDIEGAEAEVFAANDLGWLDQVRCIQIELENERSSAIFFCAMAGRPFSFSRTGDVTIAVRTGA